MKSRITLVRPQDTGLEAENIKINSHAVQITSLKAAREERLTVSLQELPQEVYYFRLHSSGGWLIILMMLPGSPSLAEMSPASSEMEIRKALSLDSPFPVQSLVGFAYLFNFPVTSFDVRSMCLSSHFTLCAHIWTSDFLHPLLREVWGINIQCALTSVSFSPCTRSVTLPNDSRTSSYPCLLHRLDLVHLRPYTATKLCLL